MNCRLSGGVWNFIQSLMNLRKNIMKRDLVSVLSQLLSSPLLTLGNFTEFWKTLAMETKT